jgi:hypothetical protein
VLRRALLHRFPCALVYEVAPAGDIVVLGCFHVRQDVQDWSARLTAHEALQLITELGEWRLRRQM